MSAKPPAQTSEEVAAANGLRHYIEDRGGTAVLCFRGMTSCRPASFAEQEFWVAITRLSPAPEGT